VRKSVRSKSYHNKSSKVYTTRKSGNVPMDASRGASAKTVPPNLEVGPKVASNPIEIHSKIDNSSRVVAQTTPVAQTTTTTKTTEVIGSRATAEEPSEEAPRHPLRVLMSIFLSKEALITFFVKMVRLTLCIISLNLVSLLFKQWLKECLDGYAEKLPSLHMYVVLYFSIDFVINIVVSLMCMIISMNNNVLVASNLDYIIAFLLSLKMSWSSASYLTELTGLSQTFDYRANGLNLVETQTDYIGSIVVLNMFIPYYLIVLGLTPRRITQVRKA
jgi:hypothetical protein